MGRPRRIQYPGACYYIKLTGNKRQDLFRANQDRRQFLSLLRHHKRRYELKVHAYCLLSHDARLLVATRQTNLSLFIQAFNTTYTKYFNTRHNTAGHLFQGRYKALLVDQEQGLAQASRAIHLQPAKAGFKEKPWRYPWSSCPAYVESETGESLVDSRPVLARFAKIRIKQSVRYLKYLKEGLKSHSELKLPAVKTVPPEPVVKRHSPAQEAQRLLAEIAALGGMDEARLQSRIQWREVSALRRQAGCRG